MSHLLTISDLTIAFTGDTGTHEVTDHLSLTLDEGEIVCLVGESGCGKSVTSMSLLGLLGPGGSVTEGSICYEDRDLLTLSEKELDQIRGKEISMIFQDPMSSLNPVFTIGYQIMEGAADSSGIKEEGSVGARRRASCQGWNEGAGDGNEELSAYAVRWNAAESHYRNGTCL